MKYFLILLAGLGLINRAGQDTYVCTNVKVSLYSSAPIEDISAVSENGVSVFNAFTSDLAFSVAITSFQFEKSLMQEHFNTDYMESDKFPRASFKGKIDQRVDITREGTYRVTATGILEVHGVGRKRTLAGTITVIKGAITITSEFMVRCADHRIDVPSIVFHHIAESIRVNISAVYTPYKNN